MSKFFKNAEAKEFFELTFKRLESISTARAALKQKLNDNSLSHKLDHEFLDIFPGIYHVCEEEILTLQEASILLKSNTTKLRNLFYDYLRMINIPSDGQIH